MKTVINPHDRYQLEFKQRYPLAEKRGSNFYEVAIYFFAPRALGMEPSNYGKEQFYVDMQNYIRLEPPSIALRHFDGSDESPLVRLRTMLRKTALVSTEKVSLEYESEIKLFCCVLKSALRDYVLFIENTSNPSDKSYLVADYERALRHITAEYRALRATIQIPGVSARALRIYSFGDEFISLLTEDYTYSLMEVLSLSGNQPMPEKSQNALMALVEDEVNYREQRGYPSIPNAENDNETLIYRRSVLKKYFSSILFLDSQKKKEGLFLEQALFGLAAGVAMLFATAVAFISQSLYGTLSLPLFLALVLSYVFKDRIKDLLRLHMSRRASRFLFDHNIRLYDATHHVVGSCRESFEFIGRGKLPPEIVALRDREHITEIENGWMGERIMLYRKRIRVNPGQVRRIFTQYKIAALADIMRINIRNFLRKMDDPKKDLFVIDDNGYTHVHGARVYHLNLIVVLENNKTVTRDRYRIILTRKGIKRIEHVNHTEDSEHK